MLGYLLNEFRLKRKTENLIFVGGFLGLIFTILATAFVSIQLGKPSDFYGNLTINTLLVSVSIFLLAKRYLSKVNIKHKKLLLYISKSSFGVYLVHMLVISGLAYLGLDTLSFNPVISVPVIAIIVFVVSLGISMLLNKVPIIKKWII